MRHIESHATFITGKSFCLKILASQTVVFHQKKSIEYFPLFITHLKILPTFIENELEYNKNFRFSQLIFEISLDQSIELNLLKSLIKKKKIWCVTHTSFFYPELQEKKYFLSSLHSYLNIILHTVQENKHHTLLFIVFNFPAQFKCFLKSGFC